MKPTASVLLCLMMFVEYFIWGSWYVTMSTYMANNLHSSGVQIGAAYSALAIATMISPFIVGLIADRFFAAQRIMGLSAYYRSRFAIPGNDSYRKWLFLLDHIGLFTTLYANDCLVQQYCF